MSLVFFKKVKIKYIIVGQGLAGSCFAFECLKKNLSFILIDETQGIKTSRIAAGIFNPLILKHFTLSWKVEAFLELMHRSFREFEALLKEKYIYDFSTYHIFRNSHEIKTWSKKSKNLKGFLGDFEIKNPYSFIKAPMEMGEIKKTGRVDLARLISDFRRFLKKKNLIWEEKFLYEKINLSPKRGVHYTNLKADYIVFCQGSQLEENPFFNYLPLIKNKGELLTIRLNEIQIKEMIHSKVFLLPQKEKNIYKIGATYQRLQGNLEEKTTQDAKIELLSKLQTFLSCPFELISHDFGIRPTVIDRRPLIGIHPKHNSLALLNGLGSRGVLLAPNMAKFLIKHLENQKEIPSEIDLNRLFKFD